MSDTIRHTAGSGFGGWLKSPAFPVIVSTLGCLPLLIVHFQQLWSRPHYQYFPMVLVSVVILLQLRRTDPDREFSEPRPVLAGMALLLGLGLAVYAVLRISPLLCCAAWLLTVAAFAARSSINAWSSWALLCLLLRLPQGRDVWLIQWLQKVTTRVSSGVLDQLRIDHIQEGNVLAFPDRKLFVEEACSGVVSLFTILATAAIFGAFLRRSGFHTLLLMLAGAFWAGGANILRVVTIAVFVEKMGIDLTSGWPHDFLGLAIFCVTLVVLLSTDGLIRFLFGPIEIDESSSLESMDGNQLVRLWNWLFWPVHERPVGLLSERTIDQSRPPGALWGFLVVMVAVGFFSIGALQIWGGIGPFSAGLGVGPAVEGLSKESLPKEMAGWAMTEFRRESRHASSEFGERSRQWTYRQGDSVAVVSIDYPFPEWHDLAVCYRGVGWTLGKRSRLPDGTTAVQFPLKNSEESGWLIYDMFDQNGAPYSPPSGEWVHPRWRRLFSGDSSHWTLPTYYQVQILSVAPTLEPTDPRAVARLQDLFQEFRESIRQHAMAVTPGEQP